MSEIGKALKELGRPFPAGDIEWRVMRSMPWGQNIRCLVYPYVTARAIHERLDDVVGPANWCNTPQLVSQVTDKGILSVQVGISIRVNGEWVTKYNVSEATDVEPAKGAFSGAEKRAGEEWGIGRYLWFLGEMDADTTKTEPPRNSGWTYAKLPQKYDNAVYWWRAPQLPEWALPPVNEADKPVAAEDLNSLKAYWARKLAPGEKNRARKSERFTQLVVGMFGPFPVDQASGWTHEMIAQVRKRVDSTNEGDGISGAIPFE